MTTIKIEHSGTSQSVQLPDGFQFDVDEVEILRRGDEVVLRKKRANLREAFDLLASMPCPKISSQRDGKTHFPRSERPSERLCTISSTPTSVSTLLSIIPRRLPVALSGWIQVKLGCR